MEDAMEEQINVKELVMKEMIGYFESEKSKKLKNYQQLNQYVKKGQILFTGSSLMEQFPICEYCVDAGITKAVYNRGIGGYTTDDFLSAIDVVLLDLQPSKVFINIGTNDIHAREDGEDWLTHLLNNYEQILTKCKEKLPDTEIYLMAYYPVNGTLPNSVGNPMMKVRTNANLALANSKVAELADRFGYHFINVNDGLTDTDQNLKAEYTVDGIHMFAGAYHIVFENLKNYI